MGAVASPCAEQYPVSPVVSQIPFQNSLTWCERCEHPPYPITQHGAQHPQLHRLCPVPASERGDARIFAGYSPGEDKIRSGNGKTLVMCAASDPSAMGAPLLPLQMLHHILQGVMVSP